MKIVLLGAGSVAREAAEIVRACRRAGTVDIELAGYLADPEFAAPGTQVDGLPVLGGLDWLAGADLDAVRGVAAVGAPSLRWRLVAEAQRYGLRFTSLVHPSVIHPPDLRLGEGCVVMAAATASVAVRLGDHVLVQPAASLAHDVALDDFATVSPGVHLGGRCRLGRGSFLGIGSRVVQDRRIGDWSIVGAGATVLADVADDTTVVGTPARVVARRDPGWHRSPGHEPV